MKSNLFEKFKDEYALASHYTNHVKRDPRRQDAEDENSRFNYMTPEFYEYMADELARTPAGHSTSREADIVGYINRDGNVVKYWKRGKQFLVYNPETMETITLFKADINKYISDKRRNYRAELPENDNIN